MDRFDPKNKREPLRTWSCTGDLPYDAPMSILVGTASWTDKTLIDSKKFYPTGCTSAEARLRYYASLFPLVEVDSS